LIVDYKYENGYVKFYIPRNRGKFQGLYECLIDTDDFERIKGTIWNVVYRPNIDNFYVAHYEYIGVQNGKSIGETTYLHNYIMGANEGQVVDHINMKRTLDNKRSNLRVSESSDNSANRKGANSNNKTGVRNVHKIWVYNHYEYWVQIMRYGKRFKWEFSENEFDKACKFAEQKRQELFGEYAGNG